MSLEIESKSQKHFIEPLKNFQFACVVWDLDETLGDTQSVVKRAFDEHFGTDYSVRALDRFDALSHWAAEDGVATYEEANLVETHFWTDPQILQAVKPYSGIQNYTQEAGKRGKIQYIITSRNNRLKEVTRKWVEIYFPWIPTKNVRITPRKNVPYDRDYKKVAVATIQPDFVFDDNLNHILEILSVTDKTRIVWFSRSLETNNDLGERVLVLPDGQKEFGKLMSHNIDKLPFTVVD